MDGGQAAMIIFGVVLVVAAAKLFTAPMKLALKLGLNTALGFLSLCALNMLGPLTGITLGVNLLNSLVIAFLGIPGFALLLIIRWLFAL